MTRSKSCAFTVKIFGTRFTNEKFNAGKRYIPASMFATLSWLRSVADFGRFTFLVTGPGYARGHGVFLLLKGHVDSFMDVKLLLGVVNSDPASDADCDKFKIESS